jgi:leucyl aminopeptidase
MYLTRDLVNEPASHMHPETMVEVAFRIEKESKGKIKVDVLDRQECQRLGMGAFLGVAQGSVREPKFIVLKYQGSKSSPSVCLVGKSITFDSGGLSLKPAKAMEDMKIDMAGGATVLGIFSILSKLDIKRNVYGVLPACENMPSGTAIRPGDIVKSLNGKTTEVVNTDAEGRLALSDALAYAEKYLKPDIIIDLATLTGACMVALGADIAGLFGNDRKIIEEFKEIAKREGDPLWTLPLYKPYLKKMKSDIADFKNVTGTGYGGAITAALYLNEFVDRAKWLHIDIAGPAHRADAPFGIWPKGATGWGVTSLVEFLRSA